MKSKRVVAGLVASLAGSMVGVGAVIVPVVGPTPGRPVVTATVHGQQLTGAATVGPGWNATVRTPANLVGVHWDGDPSARFAVESRNRAGVWNAVTEVGFEADHRPDAGTLEARRARLAPASEPVWVGDAQAVRVRLVRGSARQVTVDEINSPPVHASGQVAGAAAVAMPGIISRPEWAADESLRLNNCPEPPDISTNVTIAAVHHTGGNNNYRPQDSPAIVRGLYAYATQTLHYCDTHYNFFVDRYGQIFEGRFGSVWDPVRAAHATGFNAGSVGVALIGNFQNEAPPAAAITALENLLAWKLNWHGVDPTRPVDYTTISGTDRWPAGSTHTLPFIVGHRDPGQTDCPGDFVYAQLPAIRFAVAAKILSGGADAVNGHPVQTTQPKVAVLGADGTVYPAGGAGELRASVVWPQWAIARDVELTSDGSGGYTMDGFGGLHPFGSAPALSGGPYWPGFDIARDLVLRPRGGGWILDGWGGVHAFGGAPRAGGAPYSLGNDYAKKLVRINGRFNVLDAFGGLHPFASGPHVDSPYWPGWAVARDIRTNPDGPGGYLLDAYGGIWPVGGAPTLPGVPYFGRDRARGFVLLPGGRGYTVRDDGALVAFGGAGRLLQGRATWVNARPISSPWTMIGVAGTP